jgi:hypothetical protein
VTEATRKAAERRQGRAARYEVELPEGVTAADWGLERVRAQNPCIRSYLGCIRLLEEVLDSNYAILHCSPERLLKIWRQVDVVCGLLRSELVPTLREPSVVPRLAEARRNAEAAFLALADDVLAGIERQGSSVQPDQLPEVRRLLCVSIGRIHAFVRDTFGEIVAADPRSRHDADYFLSRRFAQDIEESEWLYASVYELHDMLHGLAKACSSEFADVQARMQRERMVTPSPRGSSAASSSRPSSASSSLRSRTWSASGESAWTTWRRSSATPRGSRATAGRCSRCTRSGGPSSSS